MDAHERLAQAELAAWSAKMVREPGAFDRATAGLQGQIVRIIPEKVHAAVTKAIEQMTRGILAGSDLITKQPLQNADLATRDHLATVQIHRYRTLAAAEGGVAGAGGFLLAVADFPALIAVKIKLLFELSAIYGHDATDWDERLFILTVFQLAFSNKTRRREVFGDLQDWDARCGERPQGPETFDWRTFQQQYRDYIDLAKLAQLIPVIGAPVGAVVNWSLTQQVGEAGMMGYRMRWLSLKTG